MAPEADIHVIDGGWPSRSCARLEAEPVRPAAEELGVIRSSSSPTNAPGPLSISRLVRGVERRGIEVREIPPPIWSHDEPAVVGAAAAPGHPGWLSHALSWIGGFTTIQSTLDGFLHERSGSAPLQ